MFSDRLSDVLVDSSLNLLVFAAASSARVNIIGALHTTPCSGTRIAVTLLFTDGLSLARIDG